MSNPVQLLKRLYVAFNARDLEGVLAVIHPDVIWANGMEGGYVCGHDALRDYWRRQWERINPHVDPVDFSSRLDREMVAEVHQVVRNLQGTLVTDKMVGHIFWIEDGLVKRFDIRNPWPAQSVRV